MKKALAVSCIGVAAVLASGGDARGQPYPNRPITLVMPYSAGTGIDTATRALAEKLRQNMKQSVIVQNKVGAGGNIGSEFVARAAPDGYTLLVVANTLAMNPSLYKNLPYDPVKDFQPIGLLFKGAMVLVGGRTVSARDLSQFIDQAAKAPGRYNYASAGVGTPQHLAMELLKDATGMDVLHIPHKGAGEAVTAIAGGQVEVGFVPIQSALAQIDAGHMHALAVSSPRRHAALPDVPTVSESIGKPFDVDLWYGMFAPAGTPAPVVAQLQRAVQDALKLPEVRESLASQGMVEASSTPAELAALVESDLTRWAQVIKARGIQPN